MTIQFKNCKKKNFRIVFLYFLIDGEKNFFNLSKIIKNIQRSRNIFLNKTGKMILTVSRINIRASLSYIGGLGLT